jgi:protein TonB
MEKTVAFPPPIVEEDVVEVDIKTEKDLTEGAIDKKDQEGDKGTGIIGNQELPPPPPELPEVDIIHTNVQEVAEFAGYRDYMTKNFNYPETAIDEGLEGKCYVDFVVDKTGKISGVKIHPGGNVKGCPECDAEAIRVISKMPNWTPAKIGGKPVSSYFTQLVRFQLN